MKKNPFIFAAIACAFLAFTTSCSNDGEYFESQITSTSDHESDAVPRLRTNSEKWGFQAVTANGPKLEGSINIKASQSEITRGYLERDFRFIFPHSITPGLKVAVVCTPDGKASFDAGATFTPGYFEPYNNYNTPFTLVAPEGSANGAIKFRVRYAINVAPPYYTWLTVAWQKRDENNKITQESYHTNVYVNP